MRTRTRGIVAVVITTVVVAAAAYLRDPPWLLSTSSGMHGWETDASGARVRWTGGHASFFVPADARAIEIPWPITVSVAIDDRPADRIVLENAQWHQVVLVMPPRGTRRVRRIDIRADRTRDDNRGAALGAVVIRR